MSKQIHETNPPGLFKWSRRGGYEVSSRGDRRFSAFYAYFPDGLSVEWKYQCQVKGYSSVREGKGKPPLDKNIDLWKEYLELWRAWAKYNMPLMRELYKNALAYNGVLSDMFAKTPINQARALATILNELNKPEEEVNHGA